MVESMRDVPTYRAFARRVDGWWAVEVDGVPGAVTQARRLDQVEAMAREVVSLMLEIPPDTFGIDVVPQIGALDAEVASARQARVDADRIRAEAMESTRRTATRLAQRGFPLRDIGLLLGISFQRVQQLLQGAAATEKKLPRLDSNQQPAG